MNLMEFISLFLLFLGMKLEIYKIREYERRK